MRERKASATLAGRQARKAAASVEEDAECAEKAGVYVERPGRSVRFRWVKAPTSAELTALTERIARRAGRFLERQGVLERDEEKSYLAGEAVGAEPMDQLLGHSISYRVAVGPYQARKVFTLQTLAGGEEPFDAQVGKGA